MSGFNLKSIRQLASAEVSIKDVDGNPTGVVFEVAGPEHPERKRIQFAQSRKAMARYQKTGKIDLPDPEEAEAMKLEALAAYTLGWKNYTDDDGVPVPFSKAAVTELYRDPEMAWLVAQVDAAIGDKDIFIQRSVAT
jgi:hypothetical protein